MHDRDENNVLCRTKLKEQKYRVFSGITYILFVYSFTQPFSFRYILPSLILDDKVTSSGQGCRLMFLLNNA